MKKKNLWKKARERKRQTKKSNEKIKKGNIVKKKKVLKFA